MWGQRVLEAGVLGALDQEQDTKLKPPWPSYSRNSLSKAITTTTKVKSAVMRASCMQYVAIPTPYNLDQIIITTTKPRRLRPLSCCTFNA